MTQHATNPNIRQLRHRLEGIRTRVRLVLIGHSLLKCSSILLGSVLAVGVSRLHLAPAESGCGW